MPKKKWTTKEQEDWLSERIPAFVQAQQEKTTAGFFPPVYESWYKEFPSAEPTPDDIAAAGSDIAKAEALVKKKQREVIFFLSLSHTFLMPDIYISLARILVVSQSHAYLYIWDRREKFAQTHEQNTNAPAIPGIFTAILRN